MDKPSTTTGSGDLLKFSDKRNIPQDLNESILQWLPVKSLLRFKVTCKDWMSLFTQQKFIYKQLKVSKRRLFLHIRGSEVWQYDLQTLTYSRIQDFGEEIRRISHCDGLVVLITSCYEPSTKTHSTKIGIWNCSDGACAWIPGSDLSFSDFFTLGRDSKKSYRLLRFSHGYDLGDFEPEADLYDLESHKWKTVHMGDDWFTIGRGSFGVVSVETSSYWVAVTEGKIFVQSFDFCAESFRAIALPEEIGSPPATDSPDETVALSPFEEQKLCILYQRAHTTELWITQVGGDVLKWEKYWVLTRHPRIPQNPSFLIIQERITLFWEEVTDNGTLAKIKLRQISQAGFEETEIAQYRYHRSTRSCVYTESLVPVP